MGFITGKKFLEMAEVHEEILRPMLKYESMIDYVTREMIRSVITEDIFK